jgi:hypothetical protein
MKAHAFLRIAERTTPFTSVGGRAFVTVLADNLGRRTLALHSTAFRDWFYAQSFAEFDTVPSAQAFRTVCHHIHAQATLYRNNRDVRVGFRVDFGSDFGRDAPAASENILRLDLANSAGQYVEISPSGWKVAYGTGVTFETSPSTAELPEPQPAEPGTDPAAPLDLLRSTLRLAGPDWLRALAWLLAALRPHGPYPILILRGPSGSGKSLAARALRAMVDPSASPVTPLPASARELLTFARHNWILAFDHVTSLTPAVSDALCRLSSGVGVAVREPGCPDPLQSFLKRPILLTAPDSWTPPPDLAARALVVTIPPLADPDRRPESELSRIVGAALPQILGALCTALSQALAAPPDTTPAHTRHTDVLAWAIAAAPALNCTADDLRAAFDMPVPSDPFVDAIRALLEDTGHWSGTATDLLLKIPLAPNPRALSALLHRSLLALADAGIRLEHGRNKNERTLELSFASPDPPPSPQPSQNEAQTAPTEIDPSPEFCVTARNSGDGTPGPSQASASSPAAQQHREPAAARSAGPSREAAPNPPPAAHAPDHRPASPPDP